MKKNFLLIIGFLCFLSGSAQNVGIGETNPTAGKLQIKSTDSAVVIVQNSTTSGSDLKTGLFFKTGNYYSGYIATIGLLDFHRMGFFTYGGSTPSTLLERLSIADNGNIGIGIINPTAKLEINGQIKISGGSPAIGKILESDASGLASWTDKNTILPSGTNGQTLMHNGTNFLATSNLYNNGYRIGIGTSNPSSMLEIKAATGSTADLELNAIDGNNAVLRLNRKDVNSASAIRFNSGNVNLWDIGSFSKNTFDIIYVPTSTTVLSMDNVTRNIGIGTLDYTSKLNIGGPVTATDNYISKGANSGYQFQDRSANAYGGWTWYADAGKSHLYRYGGLGNVLSINESGNVGIKNSSPTSPLSFPASLGKKISLYPGATGDVGIGVYGNEFRFYSDNSSADLTFGYDNFTNGFTEKMRVKASGSVGIGVTAPSVMLDVNGRLRLRKEGAYGSGLWIDGPTELQQTFIGMEDNDNIGFFSNTSGWVHHFNAKTGVVRIGTTQAASGYMLNVGGKVIAEEVRVQLKTAWPDYVFGENHQRLSIYELEKFVTQNKHLPNIPSASEIEKDGQQLGEMQRKMLEKIEELSLYIIELKKEIDLLKSK